MGAAPSTHECFLEVSSTQNGVVDRAGLVAAGFSVARIDRARKSRRLLPVFRGVYAVGREVETTEAVWRAATIAAGKGAVLMGKERGRSLGDAQPPVGVASPDRGCPCR